MKAEDLEFKRIIPDEEDCKVATKLCSLFLALPYPERGEAETTVDSFHCGFMRGLAWAKAKYNITD